MSDTARNVVLIVESDPDTLDLIIDLLTANDLSIEVVSHGETALERISKGHPDLVLAAFDLPDMPGHEFLAQVTDAPVIFTARNNLRKELIAAVNAGAVDFVTKPFFEGELVARVMRHLQRHDFERLLLQEIAELKSA